MPVKFHKAGGEIDYAPPVMQVTGKVRHSHSIQRRDFEFLRSVTERTPKVTIPSPTMLHFRAAAVRSARMPIRSWMRSMLMSRPPMGRSQ